MVTTIHGFTYMRRAALFIAGLILFVGLPITGWGWNDLPGFLGNPLRICYCVTAAVFQFFAVRTAPVKKEKTKQLIQSQRLAIVLLQVLGIAMLLTAPWTDRHGFGLMGGSNLVRCAGLTLYSFGMAIVIMAEIWLGRFFSVQVELKEGHQLVTEGPYQYVRHPRYAGLMLFHLGYALVFLSLPALVCALLMAWVLLWRIQDEERLLQGEFKEKWEAYKKTSHKLVPYLY
jgi:protein-S-isoprenylcysteine O-methyltransferase Ste14